MCRKTKTIVITLVSHKGHRQSSEPIKLKLKVNTERERVTINLDEKVARKFSVNAKRINANEKQTKQNKANIRSCILLFFGFNFEKHLQSLPFRRKANV